MAARELGYMSLMNALSLVLLYAEEGSPKFEPQRCGGSPVTRSRAGTVGIARGEHTALVRCNAACVLNGLYSVSRSGHAAASPAKSANVCSHGAAPRWCPPLFVSRPRKAASAQVRSPPLGRNLWGSLDLYSKPLMAYTWQLRG
jgi:hypothetical protein